MRQKIQTLLDQLNHGLIAREDTLKAVLLTVLAGENIVLIGPPGTGKSMLARRMAEGLGGAEGLSYFEYLLTKFSTPEELFGPLSISALKQDRFHRNTTGYLPSVELAFLDEVFKASSSILNALLTLMNERLFHNGAHTERAPLRSLIAASNELPTGQEELAALYDRFLVRCFVDYVGEDKLHLLLAAPPASQAPVLEQHITQAEIDQLQTAAQSVTLPAPIAQALQDIWLEHRQAFKEDRREQLSDRRLMKCLHLLRISAATNGRTEVDLSDLLLLKDCLWNHPENTNKVRTLVLSVLQRHSYEVQSSPVTNAIKQAYPAPAAFIAPKAKMNEVVQGLAGKGTQNEPLLIQSAQDLMLLVAPEIGMNGYHFQQVKDIDLSIFKKIGKIYFHGFYDGKNHIIKNAGQPLFYKVQKNSRLQNISLEGMGLSEKAEDSEIKNCSSKFIKDQSFINSAIKCKISECYSDAHLLGENSGTLIIEACTSIDYLFNLPNPEKTKSKPRKIIIKNSRILGDITQTRNYKKLSNLVLENCIFISRIELENPRYQHHRNKDAELLFQKCLIGGEFSYPRGTFDSSSYNTFFSVDKSKLSLPFEISFNKCMLIKIKSIILFPPPQGLKNYSTEENNTQENGNQWNKTPVNFFNEKFFSETLEWNLKDIWQWDKNKNQPELRQTVKKSASAVEFLAENSKESPTQDLLTQQVRTNIWL